MAKLTASARKQPRGTEAEIDIDALFDKELSRPEGDLIDGSEDDTTALEQGKPAPIASAVGSEKVSSATAAAKKAVLKAAAHKRVKEEMSETSKAEMIRAEIAARKAAGEKAIRPRDIVAALAAKNVKVHAPQVSVALRDFGQPAAPKKAAKTPPAVAKTEKANAPKPKRVMAKVKSAATSKPSALGPSYEELTTVGQFVSGIGGLDKAREMLDAYARLLNPLK